MYDNILVPTDGSDVAMEAVRHAIHLAKQDDALLHVVNVVDPDRTPSDVSSLSVDDELAELSEGLIDNVRDMADDEGVEVEGEILTGAAYKKIIEYAKDHDVDLIVMGTHGRKGVSRVILGSVAEKVMRNSEIPVLTVHLHTDD